MVENSSAGLAMVGGDVSVTVTKEERHQAALALYRVGATVAVELGWCVIESGKHRGERAVEVRLDGRRVGELTFLMSQRYGPLVSQVAAGGGRAGCEAVIEAGAKGLEIVLRLPREGRGGIPVPPVTPEETTIVMAPVPARAGAVPSQVAAVSSRPKFLSSRPVWIAAAVFASIVFFGIIGSTGDDETTPAAGPATETTTTTSDEPTTTTTTPPPTTTTTTKPPAPKPKPVPKVTTEEPAPPPPPPAPEPEPEPEPVSNCDPNYSGCVPVADDVDCAGGSGNGPAYVQGPVRVIGSDIYDLDRDGDGTACDS